MPLASSAALNHQPAVHPHEPGIHLTTSLAGDVVTASIHGLCRAHGVVLLTFVVLDQVGCRRLVTVCRVDFANPLVRPFCPHLPNPSVTLASSHGGLFKCGQKLPGNEQ